MTMFYDEFLRDYYNVNAEDVAIEDALHHSYKKWVGIGKWVDSGNDPDDLPILVDSDTCSLCHHYYKPDGCYEHPCFECPIYKYRGCSCDKFDTELDDKYSPWVDWNLCSNPQPMIDLLRRCIPVGF